MNFLFRRSASIASSAAASRQVLAALLSSELSRFPVAATLERYSGTALWQLVGSLGRRELHFAAPLGFRATEVARAEIAIAEFYEEGKRGDEGLEISKLGISQEIVSSLAKKNITRLFPIQSIPQ